MDPMEVAHLEGALVGAGRTPPSPERPEAPSSRPRPHWLRVRATEPVAEDALRVSFDVPPELTSAFAHRAGQHVSLRAPEVGDDLRRSYSVATPAGSGRLEVVVQRLEGGRFSTYVHEGLRPGTEIEVMTPTGRFTTDFGPDRCRHYGFVAGGSGIVPIYSLLATALRVEPRSHVSLVYASRTTARTILLDELKDEKDRALDRFLLFHVLSREPQEHPLGSGRLDRARLSALLRAVFVEGSVDEWFLCGPSGLVETAAATLAAHGVDPRRVHRELYHSGPPPAPRSGSDASAASETPSETPSEAPSEAQVTAVLDGRRVSFSVPRRGPAILDALLRHRPDAPYACRGAVCGTCRARVLAGRVEMDRNFALDADEVAAGFVLTCQAHPTSPEVVVDYDQ